MMAMLFWMSVVLVFYPYVIYPVVLCVANAFATRHIKRGNIEPSVTVLIAAYNEEDNIGATVENKMQLEYPPDKLQIVIISDGSTDGTDEIVNRYVSRGVVLLRQESRRGKAAALNMGVQHAMGEILVFSDANSLFHKDALRRVVENFNDHQVGYITGNLMFAHKNESVNGNGSSAYMKYENWLRQRETDFGSIVGVNGGVDAIRHDLYVDIPDNLITDFVLPLSVLRHHGRVVYDTRVHSHEEPNSEIRAEFRMRVRVALRALQGLSYMRALLNPVAYGRVAFSLISHKLLRYLTPVFMVIALLLNLRLAMGNELYMWLLGLQFSTYAAAVVGLIYKPTGWLHKILSLPAYFLVSNAAFSVALVKFLRGETIATWKPRTG